MYQTIPGEERYHFENEWLSAYWHFPFDHYYDPNHAGFGPLRVFNDDTIRPGRGFPTHSHREMEIVTCVLEGELQHQDSTGGHGRIGAGQVQRMTAGTGIQHSEFNASQEEPVHLLQIWILPGEANLKPGYEQMDFVEQAREGNLLPIVSGRDHAGALHIHQDTTLYVSTLQTEKQLVFETSRERRTYLFVIGGSVQIAGYVLHSGGAVKILEEPRVILKAQTKSKILLIDLGNYILGLTNPSSFGTLFL